jgi:hypothetical protein
MGGPTDRGPDGRRAGRATSAASSNVALFRLRHAGRIDAGAGRPHGRLGSPIRSCGRPSGSALAPVRVTVGGSRAVSAPTANGRAPWPR